MAQKIVRDIAIDVNQFNITASWKNSKIAIIDLSSYEMGGKKPTVRLTPNDSGSQPLYKKDVTPQFIKIRSKQSWTGTCDCEITKTY